MGSYVQCIWAFIVEALVSDVLSLTMLLKVLSSHLPVCLNSAHGMYKLHGVSEVSHVVK